MKTETIINSPTEKKEDTYLFKTKMAGYDKKEVDTYISDLKQSVNSSIESYEEKITELKDNLKIITKELEISNQKYRQTTESYNEISQQLKLVEDQSDNIQNLMQENEDLKKQLEENENYIKLFSELKVRNSQLESQVEEFSKTQEDLEKSQKDLEKAIYNKNSELKQTEFKYKTETAELNVKIEMAEDRRQTELNKINSLLNEVKKTIEIFNTNR